MAEPMVVAEREMLMENEVLSAKVSDDVPQKVLIVLREQMRLIEKGVLQSEERYILRVIRKFAITRRKITPIILCQLSYCVFPPGKGPDSTLYVLQTSTTLTSPHVDANINMSIFPKIRSPIAMPRVEVFTYFSLLLMVKLLDSKNYTFANSLAEELLTYMAEKQTRSMDLITAKVYYFYARIAELDNKLDIIRPNLYTLLRTATLRNQHESQAVLINCLLRNYLHFSLYGQAEKLLRKTVFPENASNNEWARYFYYCGRIATTKLQYSEAHKNLINALRKAPQVKAVGFRQTTQKYIVVVELLLGAIPERRLFRQAELRKTLAPYLQLTHAVRLGDPQRFSQVFKQYGAKFQQDGTYVLIMRLRQNVIKTAVRTIAVAYSCITWQDIAKRLILDSPEEAAEVMAKAIRDGVIEATLNAETKTLCTREPVDVYKTREPSLAFNERITFCLKLHNDSVKAMRYPKKVDESGQGEKGKLKQWDDELTEEDLEELLDGQDDI